MRALLWLKLKDSRFLRKLYALPFASHPMRALSYFLLPSNQSRALRVRNGPGKGLIFELNPRWETPLWEGTYEVAIETAILESLGPNTVFYDIGAAVGFYSLLAARSGASVFAFEPDSKNAASFERHVQLNALQERIVLVRSAVASWNGDAQLEPATQERGHGNAHVFTGGNSPEGTLRVTCTTLDSFSTTRSLPHLIKIDVEGFESEVFQGAKQLFDRCRPAVICEIHDLENESVVTNWLLERDYKIRWVPGHNSFPKHLIALSK